MVTCKALSLLTRLSLLLISVTRQSFGQEESYLRYIKDECYIKGEALSCVKYKALKLATKAIFGDTMNSNGTIGANNIISFVPLDAETLKQASFVESDAEIERSFGSKRGFVSEWAKLTKYFVTLIRDFFRNKGLRFNLPDGARAIEEENEVDVVDGRGRKKKLAVILPLLSLLAALKTKMLLIPVLLTVLFIKKLLLLAAVLLPGLLSTLKACKMHHHAPSFYSHWGSSDASDVSTGYSNNYAYTGSGSYGKDWASNRAYTPPKPRPTPIFITAPGTVA